MRFSRVLIINPLLTKLAGTGYCAWQPWVLDQELENNAWVSSVVPIPGPDAGCKEGLERTSIYWGAWGDRQCWAFQSVTSLKLPSNHITLVLFPMGEDTYFMGKDAEAERNQMGYPGNGRIRLLIQICQTLHPKLLPKKIFKRVFKGMHVKICTL